jgi:hypothetical protein
MDHTADEFFHKCAIQCNTTSETQQKKEETILLFSRVDAVQWRRERFVCSETSPEEHAESITLHWAVNLCYTRTCVGL